MTFVGVCVGLEGRYLSGEGVRAALVREEGEKVRVGEQRRQQLQRAAMHMQHGRLCHLMPMLRRS